MMNLATHDACINVTTAHLYEKQLDQNKGTQNPK